jgi:hypothetical protein
MSDDQTDNVIPGAEPNEGQENRAGAIEIPPQVTYGICIFETDNPVGEPIIHVHAPGEFGAVTVGHLLRLLYSATVNIEAELMYSKFQSKAMAAKAQKSTILKPGDA